MLFVVVKVDSVEYDRCVIGETNAKNVDDNESDTTKVASCACVSQLFDEDLWRPLRLRMDASVFSCVVYSANLSPTFRTSLIRNLVGKESLKDRGAVVCPSAESVSHLQVEADLTWPRKIKLDEAWNHRMQMLLDERVELENLMAWLSTLGGAYSALGEGFHHCAETAGKISKQQLQIALKLGDPLMMARCKVYLAISLLQRGFVRRAKSLIMQQHEFAKSLPENAQDKRLLNMCQGVWAKLRYTREEIRRKANESRM